MKSGANSSLPVPLRRARGRLAGALIGIGIALAHLAAADRSLADGFKRDIRPILENYCFDCHADGANKGNVAFDKFKSDREAVEDTDLWWRALKNLRAGIMPPPKKRQPTKQEKEQIAQWIKRSVFQLDPNDPDPGHVTIRRLNRVEYRNTIRHLTGVDFSTRTTFPPDETGYGFDNIGDVLTLSPMLLEKYMLAANEIVSSMVAGKDQRTFFPEKVPDSAAERRACARKLLSDFAGKAFRRPADSRTVDRLVDVAEQTYTQRGKTFQDGIAQAMVAILASPRMLFLEERPESRSDKRHPLIDEYSLASRLSYFLWSTMPDDELMRQAEAHTLRKNLSAQVERMLKDKRSAMFVRDFTGQWLRARDIEQVPIESSVVLARETGDDASASGKKMTHELRRSMRMETEKVFDYVLREDRSLLELLDCDYTFLNEALAKHYGITNAGVSGEELRLVKLPTDSPRGGILTEGTILGVTSNPTRTSPVKRGLFILDSVLGTPTPPPPPNIPPLEDASQKIKGHAPTLRETLAAHRENPMCASCHNRMDPLGLALENFNAMGMWRSAELGQPIDAAGELITGEKFSGVRDLKLTLVKNHRIDFYRAVTEKMLTYAIGRGLDYYDVDTVDQLVARLDSANGRPSVLLRGIIESAPFQKMRSATEQQKMKVREKTAPVKSPASSVPKKDVASQPAPSFAQNRHE